MSRPAATLEPDTLHLGDAYDLARRVAPGSVKLIFADPLYSDYPFYAWTIDELAPRVLSEQGNVLLYTNGLHLLECAKKIRSRVRTLSVVQQTNGSLSGDAIAKSYHLLWAGSHRTVNGKMPDGWISNTWAHHYPATHRWTKNPDYVGLLLERFTRPGELVLDLTMGDGLIPWMAKRLNRRFIGIDRDPAAVANAVRLIDQCQPRVLKPSEEGVIHADD